MDGKVRMEGQDLMVVQVLLEQEGLLDLEENPV